MTPSPPLPAFDDTEAVYCPHCDYDLRMLTGPTCPECGGAVDHEAVRRCQIPWVYRHEIGRFRAFWRTVWQVTFKTRRFCHEIAHPVDLREARRFQRAVVIHAAALPGAVWLLLLGIAFDPGPNWPTVGQVALFGALALLGMVLWLFLATGVPSYWFHPRRLPMDHQNRAVALSYYTCAPWAFLLLTSPLLAVGIIGMVIAGEVNSFPATLVIGGIAALCLAVVLAIPVAWWRTCLSFASRAARRHPGELIVMAVALPLIWLLLAVLVFVVPLALGAYMWLMLRFW